MGILAAIPSQQTGKVFRVFVSSTFSDLKAERDALQEKVFPGLRALCAEHGSSFQAIDLRWGVGKESSLDQKTMKICIDELARCQEMSPRPNFIVLLGDRYGWRPLPSEIEATEFEKIINYVDNEEDQGLIHKWYKRDDNAIPPVYLLKPVKEDEKEEWDIEEKRVHAALLDGARKAKLSPPALFRYESSATEQEIEVGALSVENAADHVFCFFRTIEGHPPRRKVASRFLNLDSEGKILEESHNSLEGLKDRLKEKLGNNVHEYKARWKRGGITTDHLDPLCRDVYAKLSGVILAEIQSLGEQDELEREKEAHRLFAKERSECFTGRDAMLRRIAAYIDGDDPHPLAVYGEGGSGKSALAAFAARQAQKAHPGVHIIYRFIGVTPSSSYVRELLKSLCTQLARTYKKDESSIPTEYEELVTELRSKLTLTPVEKPVILFIDSLDQLSPSYDAASLNWLPDYLSANVRVVVTTRPGRELEALIDKLPEENVVGLGPMPVAEGDQLLSRWLTKAKRTLTNLQRQEVLHKFVEAGSSPLYLKIAFEEARLWTSYAAEIELNPRVKGVIENLYGRLSVEKNHGQLLTSRSLGYIAASRYGLSEEELIDILSLDREVMDDFQKRSPDSPEVSTLPFIVWSRIYEDLKPYLVRKSAQGVKVITFYHGEFGDVAKEKYLRNGDGRERHIFLADYFSTKKLNPRQISELPWQLSQAEEWGGLYDLLSDLSFFSAASYLDEFEVKTYWAQVETNSSFKIVEAYKPLLDDPNECTWHIARLLQDTGSLEESKSLWEYLVEYCRETGDLNSLQACLNNEAPILRDQGDLDGAMKLHKESEEICRELGNRDGLGNSLMNQAIILQMQGDLDGAMKLCKESEKICRELGNRDGLEKSLGNQANILQAQGDLDGAMKLYKESEKMCRELGNRDGLIASLNNEANILQAQGDLDGAMKLHKESEKMCRELGNRAGLIASLNNQALILQDQGDQYGATKLFAEQEKISRELGNKDGLLKSLGGSALSLQIQGDLDGAMKLHKESEEMYRELGNKEHLQASLGNQAVVHMNLGDLDGAMKLLKEQEKMCRELDNPDGLSVSLGNQALVLRRLGDLEGAVKLFKEEEKICRKLNNPDGLQHSLGNQALVLMDQGDLNHAMKLHKEKEKICRELGNPNGLAISLANQALILQETGHPAEALSIALEAYVIADSAGLTLLAERFKQQVADLSSP